MAHYIDGRVVRKPMPPISNSPDAVLSAWIALEVLSPPSFRRPEDLAGDKQAVARLDGERLPWEEGGEKVRPNTRLYYQIILGTVKLEAAVERLMVVYGDTRVERPKAYGEAVLAAVTVDQVGRPIDEPAVAISSLGWAVPRALAGDLDPWERGRRRRSRWLRAWIRSSDTRMAMAISDR